MTTTIDHDLPALDPIGAIWEELRAPLATRQRTDLRQRWLGDLVAAKVAGMAWAELCALAAGFEREIAGVAIERYHEPACGEDEGDSEALSVGELFAEALGCDRPCAFGELMARLAGRPELAGEGFVATGHDYDLEEQLVLHGEITTLGEILRGQVGWALTERFARRIENDPFLDRWDWRIDAAGAASRAAAKRRLRG